jgi:hypothetical protein
VTGSGNLMEPTAGESDVESLPEALKTHTAGVLGGPGLNEVARAAAQRRGVCGWCGVTAVAACAVAGGWRHRASCRDGDLELLFPVVISGPVLLQIAEAKHRVSRRTHATWTVLRPPPLTLRQRLLGWIASRWCR